MAKLTYLMASPTKTTVKPSAPDDDLTGFDWRNVPNAEMNGDRRDAYQGKTTPLS